MNRTDLTGQPTQVPKDLFVRPDDELLPLRRALLSKSDKVPTSETVQPDLLQDYVVARMPNPPYD